MNNSKCANCEAYWAVIRGEMNPSDLESRCCPHCYDTCGEDYDY